MELLGIWIGTCITSLGMDIANGFRMFKDVADAGYKIDIDRISEITESLNPNASKMELLKLLIPGFNFMYVSQQILEYNNLRPMVLDQLGALNVLEEMTDEEYKEYLKRPTGLNAILVSFNSEIRLAKSNLLILEKPNFKCEIYYEIGENGDITILKVNGDASKLSLEEQKEIIYNLLKDEKVVLTSDLSETLEDIYEETNEPVLEEQIEELKAYKEELLNTSSEEYFKEETKVRKRK